MKFFKFIINNLFNGLNRFFIHRHKCIGKNCECKFPITFEPRIMKYYANGFEYQLYDKIEDRDVYVFIRPGKYIIFRSHYQLVKEGVL